MINGIEFRVRSVLADDFTVRAYVEARDLEGDIFSRVDDLQIPGRVVGWIEFPPLKMADALSSGQHETVCLGCDEEAKTALLCLTDWWAARPDDLTGTTVRMGWIDTWPSGGECEEVWSNKEGAAIPVDVTVMDSAALDGALVSSLGAEEAYLSPLGLTIIVKGYETRPAFADAKVSVNLEDGSTVEAVRGGDSGFGRLTDSRRGMIWNFPEPVEPDQVAGVSIGEDYFPVK